jgi:hypothetical protein
MASKRQLRRRSCTGKVRYPERGPAEWARKKSYLRFEYTGKYNVYKCTFCNGWHIGHNGRA